MGLGTGGPEGRWTLATWASLDETAIPAFSLSQHNRSWRILPCWSARPSLRFIGKVRDELVKVRKEPDDEPDLLSEWAKDTVPDTFQMLEDLRVKFILGTKRQRGR